MLPFGYTMNHSGHYPSAIQVNPALRTCHLTTCPERRGAPPGGSRDTHSALDWLLWLLTLVEVHRKVEAWVRRLRSVNLSESILHFGVFEVKHFGDSFITRFRSKHDIAFSPQMNLISKEAKLTTLFFCV